MHERKLPNMSLCRMAPRIAGGIHESAIGAARLSVSAACLLTLLALIGSASVSADEIPATMRQCEGGLCEKGGGGTWTFDGRKGKARWTIGVEADLTVERYDNGEVIIRRVDAANGSTRGATAIYRGTVRGNRIEGLVDYNWPGHFDHGKLTRTWYALIGEWAPGLEPSPPAAAPAPPPKPAVPSFAKVDPNAVPGIVKQADEFYLASNFRAAAPLYGQAAEAGNHHAQLRLARLYAVGSGIGKNCDEALRLVHVAIDAGYREGLADLGRYYNFGWCVKADGPTALSWYRKGADLGDTDAMGAIGVMYIQGKAIHQDLDLGLQWFRKAAELGDADAMASLGLLYTIGTRLPADYGLGNTWLSKAAALGNADAMNGLGEVHEKGLGVPRDLDRAYDWYQRAAALGNGAAKTHLQAFDAVGYVAGATGKDAPDGPQRFDLNAFWEGYYESPGIVFTILVRQVGLNIVAERVFTTNGAPMGRRFFKGSYDPTKRAGQIEMAEYAGDSPVLRMAGTPVKLSGWAPGTITIVDPDHFQIGNRPAFQRISTPGTADVPCERGNAYRVQPVFAAIRARRAASAGEIALAACWYHIAATQGSARSMSELGLALHEGLGVERDEAQAIEWLQKAAEHGDYYGAELLADMYRRGEGVAADPSKAETWKAKAQALKAEVERRAANELRREKKEQAELAGLAVLAESMNRSFLREILRSPACDVYGTTRDRVTGVLDSRIRQRDALIASGEIHCD